MSAELRGYVDAMAERHKAEFAIHGPTIGAVGWSEASQRKRFEVIAELGPMHNTRVLDVGCGFGDFLSFLEGVANVPAAYTGIDVVPEFVDEARRRHPGARFDLGDVIDMPAGVVYDFAVASGIFYLPGADWADWMEHVRATASKMFAICDKGVALNFLSQFSPRPDEVSYYADPGAVLNLFGRYVSSHLVLRHDYLPNDFTVYLYKRDR
jgi:SAM-dependent methyltransferase